MRTESGLCITEEVFPDLSMAELFHIAFVSIYAASRFVKLDDGHRSATPGALSVISP